MNESSHSNGQKDEGIRFHEWEELLSAYIDGELDQSERARVDQRCADDIEFRRLRDEFLSLSRSIRELPRPSAPRELPVLALDQIEKLELLGKTPESPVLSKRRLRRREWAAGLLAMMASVLVAMMIPRQNPEELTALDSTKAMPEAGMFFDDGNGMGSTSNQPVSEFEGRHNQSEGLVAELEKRNNDRLNHRSFAGTPRDEMPQNELGLPMAATMPAAQSQKLNPKDQPLAVTAENPSEIRSKAAETLESWEEVQPYLNLLAQNTSAVANVDLVVLDVEKSADQLQVLLVQNGVLNVVDQRNSSKTSDTPAMVTAPALENRATKTKDDAGSNVAVYVEAEGEPITKALQEMVRQRQVLAMKLQPPLKVEAVTKEPAANRSSGDVAGDDVLKEVISAYQDLERRSIGSETAITMSDFSMDVPVSAIDHLTNDMGGRTERERAENFQRFGKNSRLRSESAANRGAIKVEDANGNAIQDTAQSRLMQARTRLPQASEAQQFRGYNRRLSLPEMRQSKSEMVPGLAAAKSEDRQLSYPALAEKPFEGNLQVQGVADDTVRVLFVLRAAGESPPLPSASPGPRP